MLYPRRCSSARTGCETYLSRRRSPQTPREATTAKREAMMREKNDVKRVLGHPCGERRLGITDEDRERGSSGHRSKQRPCLEELRIGLVSHRAVVWARSATTAAPQGPGLRCERHDRQLAPRCGQLSALPQRRFAGAAAFEDDEDARGGPSPYSPAAANRGTVQRGCDAHRSRLVPFSPDCL
jgi:hypothetical protein